MTTEVELKFIVAENGWEPLERYLSRYPFQAEKLLDNIYYDTPDNLLRQHDIGLRIRGVDGEYEMTLKGPQQAQGITALHLRTEYNIALTDCQINLSLLPQEAFPAGFDIKSAEQSLIALFETRFIRRTWWVKWQQSEIEIACDRGEIIAGEKRERISELELELKEGRVEDLMLFSQQFKQIEGISPGFESKAARGYKLISMG